MGNILENTVECTCEEFVAEVAGERRKPYLDALKSTFKTIVLGKSTLVKEMSSFLRENEGRLERKRVQELMSGWLNAYDFAALPRLPVQKQRLFAGLSTILSSLSRFFSFVTILGIPKIG